MSDNDLLVKRYPFLGYSTNLIEYFAIIGYNEKYVPIMITNFKNEQKTTPPTILSSLTSKIDFGFVDNDLIIEQIYPDNPSPILIKNSNQDPSSTSNALYSFCFDSTDGKSKLFHVCFAFKFYEKYHFEQNNEDYYIPKAFCIISQYYYFNLFNYIFKNIHFIMSQKLSDSIPIELTIYNIVNFVPSPINHKFNLSCFNLDIPDIEIEQLSGYPYLDFDLSQIFCLLPLNLVLEIFILTFLECGMIFFSSNLELLNMIMFIMYVLNYPCNDSTYFWHIVSVSEKNFVEENKFVGKLLISMIGYNGSYNENIDTSCFGSNHFIVDIDNKKIFVNNIDDLDLDENEKREHENLETLLNYIKSLITKKEKIFDNSFIKPYVVKLKTSLESVLLKNSDNSQNNYNQKKPYVNFFNMSKSISNLNKTIQEKFYDFCLNILMLFYQDNSFNTSYDKLMRISPEETLKRQNKFKGFEENAQMIKEDDLFFRIFRASVKYKIYFENFMQNMDAIDLFKIPLLFSEEFINIKIRDTKNIFDKISYFSIIDLLYLEKNNRVTIISFKFFNDYYEKNLKKHFSCFLVNKNKNENLQLITLNKSIINKYIYLLNNLYDNDQLTDISLSINMQKENLIKNINKSAIIKAIQDSFEKNDIIEIPNYIVYGLVFAYAISIPLYPFQKMNKYLLELKNILTHLKIFARQYIYILIKAFYRFYLVHKNEDKYYNLSISSLKMYYYTLINDVLRENFMTPNEEMMMIFQEFFHNIIYLERESIYKKMMEGEREDDFIDKDDIIIEKDKNFLCFMKYNFTEKKIYTSKDLIDIALKDNKNDDIILNGKKDLHPIVNVKIDNYAYSSNLFSPKKIYKLAQLTYDDFLNKELDISKLNIKNVRDIITNLIEYSLNLTINNEFISTEFLVHTLYLLRNYEEKLEMHDFYTLSINN